ncbi:MAG: ATP-binding protein [Bacteroidales bacterium]|nr:ATP-binding protein [Bacteroidales bacterium]
MLKETLKSIILSQQEWIVAEEREIPREQLGSLKSLPPFTYILTGVRRSGKSTLLKQLMRHCGSLNYLSFEDSRTAGFEVMDFRIIEDIFSEVSGSNHMLFFDEIQNVPGWERYVRDALDRKKTIVITGSNANMLSRELGTKLTGRHLDFEVFPFSFREFLAFFNEIASATTFSSFISEGGFPGYLCMGKKELLSTLVTDILVRDIFTRYHLRNHDAYRRIVQFLLSNTGKEISFNNLKNTFEIGSASSVMDFLNFLTGAYLVFLVPLFHTSLKVQARNPRKVYAIDQGLVDFSSVSGSPDRGRLLENTVFLYLRRAGHKIWYYKGRKECDFIVRVGQKEHLAIQVSWQVDQQNEKRETEGLLEAMNSLNLDEGMIITFDQEDLLRKNGKTIRLIPGWKWMSEIETKL